MTKLKLSNQPPIIFLDVDGVLNSHQWFESEERKGGEETLASHIDPAAVQRLESVVQATGAVVVISSTWRFGSLRDVLVTMLRKYGFTGDIVGDTPRSKCADCLRGNEIRRWLDDHVEDRDFKSYVIIDDDSDILYWQRKHFVRTSSERGGLTDEHAAHAIAILKGELLAEVTTTEKETSAQPTLEELACVAANFATAELPTDFDTQGQRIWDSFKAGRAYERKLLKECERV